MDTDKKMIKRVAELANIHINDDELEGFAGDMAAIIGYMEQIKNLDTDNVKPMEHVLPISNVLREDSPEDSFDRNELIKNAPASRDGCFIVPVVVES